MTCPDCQGESASGRDVATCPDCGGALDLQEDGDVIQSAHRPWLRWVPDHTDAICLYCDAVFVIGRDGKLARNDIERPLDEVFR